jgi:hypothetical protein
MAITRYLPGAMAKAMVDASGEPAKAAPAQTHSKPSDAIGLTAGLQAMQRYLSLPNNVVNDGLIRLVLIFVFWDITPPATPWSPLWLVRADFWACPTVT